MTSPVRHKLSDQATDKRRLRWLLAGLLLVLLIPTSILASRAYDQLGYESLYRYRLISENIAQAVDAGLTQLLTAEAARDIGQFDFYLPNSEQPQQRSGLSEPAGQSILTGALGYFKIDAAGRLSTPLLPTDSGALAGLGDAERDQRQQRQRTITQLLSVLTETGGRGPAPLTELEESVDSDLQVAEQVANEVSAAAVPEVVVTTSRYVAAPAPSEVRTNQQVFDRLLKQDAGAAVAALDDEAVADTLSLDKGFLQSRKATVQAKPVLRERKEKRQDYRYEAESPQRAKDFGWLSEHTRTLEYLSIDEDHFLLYRRWWQSDKPVVLGVVLRRDDFLKGLVDSAFEQNRPPAELQLTVTENYQPIRSVQAVASSRSDYESQSTFAPAAGELLYSSRLRAPFGELQLVFSAQRLGTPPGGSWIIWSSVLLVTLLLGGFAIIYRFGIRELERRQTQQNFVSAVSHELKTPLTAIRMYGEMLKSGWVAEEKKASYYGFIFSESERLSRLISNVLRLSQISRDRLALTMSPRSVSEIVDLVRSKLQTLSEQNGVEIHYDVPASLADAQLTVDDDAFVQILINLVDNAIKFSASDASATAQRIDVTAQGLPSNLPADRKELCISVRDYGPGIPKPQLARIFELFYRGESELTRKTQGTGIGLALVAELVEAMHGRIEARNREPGAQFSVYLPLQGELPQKS